MSCKISDQVDFEHASEELAFINQFSNSSYASVFTALRSMSMDQVSSILPSSAISGIISKQNIRYWKGLKDIKDKFSLFVRLTQE